MLAVKLVYSNSVLEFDSHACRLCWNSMNWFSRMIAFFFMIMTHNSLFLYIHSAFRPSSFCYCLRQLSIFLQSQERNPHSLLEARNVTILHTRNPTLTPSELDYLGQELQVSRAQPSVPDTYNQLAEVSPCLWNEAALGLAGVESWTVSHTLCLLCFSCLCGLLIKSRRKRMGGRSFERRIRTNGQSFFNLLT